MSCTAEKSLTCPEANRSLWKIKDLILQCQNLKSYLKNMVIASGLLFQSLTPFAEDLPRHVGEGLRTTDLTTTVWIKAKKHHRNFNTENMAQNTTEKTSVSRFFTSPHTQLPSPKTTSK